MADIVLSNLLGFVLGVISSFVSWWVLFHGLVPSIRFAPALGRQEAGDDPCGHKYQFSFANVGRRALIDVQVTVRLSAEKANQPGTWNNFTFHLSSTGDKKIELPKVPSKNHRTFRIYLPYHELETPPDLFEPDVRQKIMTSTASLEDLLRPSQKRLLRVYVAGFDELSGARKMFESQPYRLEDIEDGHFDFLRVIPNLQRPAASAA